MTCSATTTAFAARCGAASGIFSHMLPRQPRSSAMWARVFALLYDPFLWIGERAGMKQERHALLGDARGRVVEIGAGTGLNVAHYPPGLDELVLTEPDAEMSRRLARRAGG